MFQRPKSLLSFEEFKGKHVSCWIGLFPGGGDAFANNPIRLPYFKALLHVYLQFPGPDMSLLDSRRPKVSIPSEKWPLICTIRILEPNNIFLYPEG